MKILIVGAGALTATLLAALSGCHTVEVVTKYEETLKLSPPGMIELCDIPPPPDMLQYVSAPWEVKEELLTTYATKLLLNQNVCNTRISSYLTWRRKQEVLYKTQQGESGVAQSITK